jgi:hypothetical protein
MKTVANTTSRFRTRLALLLLPLMLAACNDGLLRRHLESDEAMEARLVERDRELFLGTWELTSDAIEGYCDDGSLWEGGVTGAKLTWTAGPTLWEIVAEAASGFCPVRARLIGPHASVPSEQKCEIGDGADGVLKVERSSYSFDLDPGNETAIEGVTGDIEYTEGAAVPIRCVFIGLAHYRKVAP